MLCALVYIIHILNYFILGSEFLSCVGVDVVWTPNPAQCHIELPMTEAWFQQMQSNNVQCMTPSFLYCHAEAQPDWKLDALELKSQSFWYKWYFCRF